MDDDDVLSLRDLVELEGGELIRFLESVMAGEIHTHMGMYACLCVCIHSQVCVCMYAHMHKNHICIKTGEGFGKRDGG